MDSYSQGNNHNTTAPSVNVAPAVPPSAAPTGAKPPLVGVSLDRQDPPLLLSLEMPPPVRGRYSICGKTLKKITPTFASPDLPEPLLTSNPDRFVFTVTYQDINAFYQKQKASFWVPSEIDFAQDLNDWSTLSNSEKHFIKHVLAFFAASDGIVNQNLAENFIVEIQLPEARAFLSIQGAIETIHSETYSLSLETLVPDRDEQLKLFRAVQTFPAIKKKAEWALKWTDRDSASFAHRLIAFAVVEGLFFSGSFCAIFWLKSKNLLPGICFANDLIARDEGLHCEFALHLYNNYIVNKLPEKEIKEIVISAFEAEKDFVIEALPVSLLGMDSKTMTTYLQYVADRLLLQLGCTKEYNVENPFPFMERSAMEGITNFFEKRVSEYKKMVQPPPPVLEFSEDF
jgi:ribonucleoside-diphosphate reductase beta chain